MDDEKVDHSKLEHQAEVAERAASVMSDQTTADRFRAFAEQVRQMLRGLLTGRRRKQEIRARAYQLWELAGKPWGRDLEFWLEAEREWDRKNGAKPLS
jgi:hypothetical protein